MNARISTPAIPLPSEDPRDLELEENALGLALLGYPLPNWLEPRDFWADQHRNIFAAIQELGDKAALPSVASLLRSQGKLAQYDATPLEVTGWLHSAHLVAMMEGADHAMRMGWAVDFGRLRELSDRRRLLDAMRRVAIGFKHDSMDCAEARELLKEA